MILSLGEFSVEESPEQKVPERLPAERRPTSTDSNGRILE